MKVNKFGGRVYGADLTSAEKKAMEKEIKRQLAEYDRKHMLEIDAMILWQLHKQFGFGPKRLRQFYDGFASATNALIERYELDDSDQIWLCVRMLKDYGVDIEKWNEERESGADIR